jgi:hypothetical protein
MNGFCKPPKGSAQYTPLEEERKRERRGMEERKREGRGGEGERGMEKIEGGRERGRSNNQQPAISSSPFILFIKLIRRAN